MSDAIRRQDPEARRQWFLIRRLLPDATHVCAICGLPLFSADEEHYCAPATPTR